MCRFYSPQIKNFEPARKSIQLILLLILRVAFGFSQQSAAGQQISPRLNSTAISALPDADQLRWLMQHSGVVFAGSVLKVTPGPSGNWLLITFLVETPVRGSARGPLLVKVLETAPGNSPLHRGERLVVFLHALNAWGVTSSVSGNCGFLPLVAAEEVDIRNLGICPRAPAPERFLTIFSFRNPGAPVEPSPALNSLTRLTSPVEHIQTLPLPALLEFLTRTSKLPSFGISPSEGRSPEINAPR